MGIMDGEKKLLGEILLRRNIITQDQLAQALERQKLYPGYLGEKLIELGFVEERDIVVALVIQCNLPYIAVDKYDIDPPIIRLISRDFALKNFVVPLDRVGNVLSVVMADPLNVLIKTQLEQMTSCQVTPFIATKSEIETAIHRWYAGANR